MDSKNEQKIPSILQRLYKETPLEHAIMTKEEFDKLPLNSKYIETQQKKLNSEHKD